MKQFASLLKENEDWLIERILFYAKKFGFTKYTSTLEEAWHLSINGLSESLLSAAAEYGNKIPELYSDYDYISDPVSAFGIIEARKHRERGVTLSMFLGLMKYYRQAYLDLLNKSTLHPKTLEKAKLFTERCFDWIEIAFCTEWSTLSEKKKIKELQDTNRRITNEKNKFLTIFESNISPTIILDGKNRIVSYNAAASELFTDLHISGTKYYAEKVSDETLKTLNHKLKGLVKSSEKEITYNTFLNTFKGWRYFRVRLKKLVDVSEKFQGTIILFEDITSLKEAEKQLEKAKKSAEWQDRMKSAFLANMSHDIRTPVHGILGMVELLQDENIPEDERGVYYNLIHSSGETLLSLINDIIDISKIEAGALQINKSNCDVHEILQELLVTYIRIRNINKKENIKIHLEVDREDRKFVLYTDKIRFRQILSNLLSNALKFTKEGSIEFGYKIYTDNEATFYVKDTGIGIPEELHKNIFNRYQQVMYEKNENIEGTGLGLAISKELVELLGGKIWVESEPDAESIFYFTIPFTKLDEFEDSSITGGLEILETPDWSDKKVLVAEDDDTNYIFLERTLKLSNIQIIRAKNGQEAIELFQKENPDVVLMDIKMPVMDGYEATRKIKKLDKKIPIIAQTAYAMSDEEDQCRAAGCDEYLVKPIKPIKIILSISKYLKTK